MRTLTDQEKEALNALGAAATLFFKLPAVHPSDRVEFVHHMHACQNIVLARPAYEHNLGLAK